MSRFSFVLSRVRFFTNQPLCSSFLERRSAVGFSRIPFRETGNDAHSISLGQLRPIQLFLRKFPISNIWAFPVSSGTWIFVPGFGSASTGGVGDFSIIAPSFVLLTFVTTAQKPRRPITYKRPCSCSLYFHATPGIAVALM